MKAFATIALFLIGWTAGGWADPAVGLQPPPPSYRVECQMVTLPAKAVVALIPELSDDAKAPAAWEKLQGMIERGEATRVAWLVARGIERTEIKAESIEQVRFATELEGARFPPAPPAARSTPEIVKFWPYVGICPVSFETRDLGEFLSAHVRRTTDPQVLDCTFAIEHVRLESQRRYIAGRLSDGEPLSTQQPFFTLLKDSAEQPLVVGKPTLVGVHHLPGPDTPFELFVLTVTASPLPRK